MSSTKCTFYVALALVAAIVLAYSHVWHCDFIDYDDNTHVYKNEHVNTGLSVENVKWAFTHFHAAQWIPLTWISFMIDVSLFGLDPGPLHLVNVAIHCVNTLLLFGVLWQMTGAYWRSACIAALFALHPINVETVAWITERKSLLNTMLWLLAICCHVRYVTNGKVRWLVATVGCMTLGIMTKAMIVTLPFTLLLLDVWPLSRVPHASWRRLVLEKAPLFALSVAACIIQIRAGMAADLLWTTEQSPILFRLANASANVLTYLGMLIFPARLAVQYPSAEVAPYGMALVAFVGVGAFLGLAWRNRVRAPYLLLGGLWFLGTLVPVSGIVQAGDAVLADRYTYVPQIGFFIVVVWSCNALFLARSHFVAPALAGAMLLILTVNTVRYTAFWTDTATLFIAAAERWPTSLKARMNAGYALAQKGEWQRALPHYEAALSLAPQLAETRSNYGAALGKLGETDAAIEQFRRAAADEPTLVMVRFNLATHLLHKEGGAGEAVVVLRQVLREDPTLTVAHYWIGKALEANGFQEEAREEYQKRLAANPADVSALDAINRLAPAS